jgi:hypothetical protein
MRTAKLHTYAPPPPGEALDVFRRGMREQMRLAHAAGIPWLAAIIGRARDVPDGRRRWRLVHEAQDHHYPDAYPSHIRIQFAAAVRIARACLALFDAYYAALGTNPPAVQPDGGERVATYPRPRTELKREQSRAHRRWKKRRHLPLPPEPPAPRTPPAMSRTRAARVQPPPVDPDAE